MSSNPRFVHEIDLQAAGVFAGAMGKRRETTSERKPIRTPVQESILIDAHAEMECERLLCTSIGLGQFAAASARAFPATQVSCTYFDLYRANLAAQHLGELPRNLTLECATDLPSDEADIVAQPLTTGGEAEFVREIIQSSHQRLRLGGKLFASIDKRDDSWLHEQLKKAFCKVERRQKSNGVLYVATKSEPLKKARDFACEFAFRDNGRLIRAFSRPGVFSHRRLDVGARHLMNEMRIESGMRILDIGCGSGTVSLAAACRNANVTVHAVDSSTRAIECTKRGSEMNELANITTELNAIGGFRDAGTYDLALANPPYYSGFRIAEHFLIAGREALRPGGEILVVTKQPEWYRERMPTWYEHVAIFERKGYHLARGLRPS